MGVDLGGVQVVMAQDLLNGPDIHAVLQHQRGGGVPQLVGGILTGVDPSLGEALFHHGVDAGAADALIPGREEEGVGVPPGDGPPDGEILLQRHLAGLVEIEDADLVSLAQDPQRLALDITAIQPHQL